MARRLSKEDIIKAIDSDDSNEKLKEILGSDSGSAIKDFIFISSVRHQNIIPAVNFLLFELAPSNFHQGNI